MASCSLSLLSQSSQSVSQLVGHGHDKQHAIDFSILSSATKHATLLTSTSILWRFDSIFRPSAPRPRRRRRRRRPRRPRWRRWWRHSRRLPRSTYVQSNNTPRSNCYSAVFSCSFSSMLLGVHVRDADFEGSGFSSACVWRPQSPFRRRRSRDGGDSEGQRRPRPGEPLDAVVRAASSARASRCSGRRTARPTPVTSNYNTAKSRNYEGAPSAPFTSLLRDNSL